MIVYSESFKAKMVRKMLPPGAVSAANLAAETGLNRPTLSRWLREARTQGGIMENPAKKKWTFLEKLRVVVEASQIAAAQLGEFLRREGIHEAQLKEWREAASAAFENERDARKKNKKSLEAMRIKELERELRRKEKALAEAAALLVLQKKVRTLGLLGYADDDMNEESEP